MKRFAVSPTVLGWIPGVLMGALFAFAQPTAAQVGPAQGSERRAIIDMDEDVIEGRLKVPDEVLVLRPTARKFRSLIQIRADFRKEVLASGSQL